MKQIHLCSEKNVDTNTRFPDEIRSLASFIRSHRKVWPLVADYLARVRYGSSPELHSKTLDFVRIAYSRRWGSLTQEQQIKLTELMRGIYNVPYTPPNQEDPRTRFLEYIVYSSDSLNIEHVRRKNIQCSLRLKRKKQYHRIVEGKSDWDVAFLGKRMLELHECKVNVSNFIPESQPYELWPNEIRNKLDFMKRHDDYAKKNNLRCFIYLTGLDTGQGRSKQVLSDRGYKCIRVIGPEEMDALL
jgi:hypothetical protein